MNNIKKIINGIEQKLIIAIGPCSIHNTKSTKILVNIIKKIQIKFKRKIIIIFRIYFEKPRTVSGWKGFIYDPYINQTYKINKGIDKLKKIINYIRNKEILLITEFLNIDIANIMKKYISIGTIGARTCESQPHRELVSYINIPCGFKNPTDGNIQIAINSILSTNKKNIMIVKKKNKLKIIKTNINSNTFLILRGGNKPNYSMKYFYKAKNMIKDNNIKTGIMIDCSHNNSKKNHDNQKKIVKYIIKNYKKYQKLIGLMLEVNIFQGKQNIKEKISKYISITDSCISLKQSYYIIKNIYKKIKR